MVRALSVCAVLCTGFALGQTRVDLGAQSRNVDFAGATSTRPVKTGTVLPSSCALGELFFNTLAAAGANLFACTATDTWVAASGGSGSGFSTLSVTRTSPSTLTIGSECSPVAPCLARFGSMVVQFSQPASVTRTAGSGTAYIYVTQGGSLTVGHTFSIDCSGCVGETGVTAFPSNSIPLYRWVALDTGWDTAGTNARSTLSATVVVPGLGLTSIEAGGATTLGIAAGLVPLRVPVPVASSDACQGGSWAADSSFYYVCVSENTWRRMELLTW